jgi:hypothetical protein
VHHGGSGLANRDKVFEMIERTPWAIPASGQLAHDTGGKTKVKRTLEWLYQVLYECRNDFLHGNPVERSNLSASACRSGGAYDPGQALSPSRGKARVSSR